MQVLDVNDSLRIHTLARLVACGVDVLKLPGGCMRLMNHHGDSLVTHDVLSLKPRIIARLTAA